MAVDLVAAGGEQRVLLVGAGGGDRVRADHPDADPLVAPGVDVTGMPDGHLVVGRVQRSDVHVVKAALAAHEHLIQGPLTHWAGTPSCLAAKALAASRTHAPSSWAARRWASRSVLHG